MGVLTKLYTTMENDEKLESWRKNEPKEKEFDASTIVYGLIFVLYLILAVVLGVFMFKKSQKKRKREEREENERKMDREQQMMLLQQKQKLLEMQAQTMQEEKRGAAAGGTSIDFKVNDVKETTFESPTEEEIKELMEKPKSLGEKKES